MTNGEAMKQLGLTDEDLAVFVCYDINAMVDRFQVELKLKNGKRLNVLNTVLDRGMFFVNDSYKNLDASSITFMLKEYWKKKDICPALQPLMIGD